MKTLLQNWNLMRFVRLVFGVLSIVQGFMVHDIALKIAGVLLSITAIVNVGCCGSSCAINIRKPVKQKEVRFEEVETIK